MTDTQPRRATLASVAAHAAVSVATASKVVNGRPDVSARTRERVERAIAALGYEGPRRGQSAREAITMLVDSSHSPYATEVWRGAMAAAEEHDLDLVMESAQRYRENPGSAAITQRLLGAGRKGLIVLSAGVGQELYADVVRVRLPLVVVDPQDSSDPEVTSVGATNWLGGRSAAEHLVLLGHRDVAMLAGPTESLSGVARLGGFRSAWEAAGLTIAPDRLKNTRFDAVESRDVARSWLSGPGRRPTAVVAGSDLQAMGVLQAAAECDVHVPGQLSVISYDDTPLASWATPRLTAVRQPLYEMGWSAVETLRILMADEKPQSRHVELSTSLVVRESTAAPPAGG